MKDFLSELIVSHDRNLNADKLIENIVEEMKTTSYIHTLDKPTGSIEVRDGIKVPKERKACGLDLVSNEMIKVTGSLI